MRRLRRFIRWLSLAALIVLVLPIVHEFALENHIYNSPGERISTLLGYLRTISEIPHYRYVLAFAAGLTLGISIDAILAGAEGRNSKRFTQLADRAFQVRESIQSALADVNRQRDHASPSLLAEVDSLMVDMRKAGIPVPFAPKGTELEKWLEMASVYFSHVGPQLRDGHLSQAREVADLVQMRLG